MVPSIDCIASLYCAEDVTGGAWEYDEQEEEEEDNNSGGQVMRLMTDFQKPTVFFMDFPVEDDDAVAVLLQKESRYMPEADYPGRFSRSAARDLNAGARQKAISWMLKVQACHNFGPLTIALSANYMDRFMSCHRLPQGKAWMLQLLSVACISLAAKMEETKVPILLDLQVENVEHIFEAHTIQRMELLVLSTLEWRMSSVTPFSYIDFYFHKLGISNTLLRALLSRVSEIILATVRETMFLVYQPSVIAAAATICSLEEVTALKAATDLYRVFVDLSVDVDALKKCCQDIQVHVVYAHCRQQSSKKRGFQCLSEPLSPVGVLEAAAFSRTGSESTMGSSRESSPGVGLVATPTTTARKRRKLDDFCGSLAWL